MKAATEITKLCESWWSKMNESNQSEQRHYAHKFLELLGWPGSIPVDCCPDASTLTYLLRGEGQTSVACHFLMPGSLEPPSLLVERGLDFCEPTRRLVASSGHLRAGYAFITDMYRAYLYDVGKDELLLYADSPGAFEAEISNVLSKQAMECGSLADIRRQPRSHAARQLREWYLARCDALVLETCQSKDITFLAIDRLIVIRYLVDHDILKRSGRRFKERYEELIGRAMSPDPSGCGTMLTALFHDFWLDWNADLFAPVPDLDKALNRDSVAAPLLKEFALLAKGKFSLNTVLESFNFGDASEKARVRMVPDENEERERYLAKQTLESVDEAHIEVDICEEGYRAIFPWFDRLVALYAHLETQFDSKVLADTELQAEGDLIGWSEKDAQRPEALREKFRYAVEHGLVIYYASPRQLRTARLMLYLHLIARYHESRQRFTRFPNMGDAFMERPTFLGIDKRRIYARPSDEGRDEWEVI